MGAQPPTGVLPLYPVLKICGDCYNPLLSNWGQTLILRSLKRRKYVQISQFDKSGITITSDNFFFEFCATRSELLVVAREARYNRALK
jgi:hypothetical protein